LSFESHLTRRIRHNRYTVPEWLDQLVYLNPYPKEFIPRGDVQEAGRLGL
jgi:hypothetical protein